MFTELGPRFLLTILLILIFLLIPIILADFITISCSSWTSPSPPKGVVFVDYDGTSILFMFGRVLIKQFLLAWVIPTSPLLFEWEEFFDSDLCWWFSLRVCAQTPPPLFEDILVYWRVLGTVISVVPPGILLVTPIRSPVVPIMLGIGLNLWVSMWESWLKVM